MKQSHHTPREATSPPKTARFEDESQHHTDKLQMSRESKRAHKTRVREEAREALAEERRASESWRPERAVEIKPEQELQMDASWKCERYCRSHTAFLSIQKGVNIHQMSETVSLTCLETHCKAKIRFLRDPSTGRWKLREFNAHVSACLGQDFGSDTNSRRNCTPVNTAKQVARLVLPELKDNPSLTTKSIVSIVTAKQIYTRQPGLHHFHAVKNDLSRMMMANRLEQMATMERYAILLQELGHFVQMFTCSADETKQIGLKAARFIFRQLKKGGFVPEEA